MRFALVVAVVGSLYLVRGEVFADTCANFVLPPPDELNAVGDPNVAEKRVLWGESYCKELTLKDLGGKTPKLCVRNENPKDQEPTGCLRLSLRNVEPAMVKSTKIGIHSDCASIPKKNKDKYQKRRSLGKLGKTIAATRICFDEIPAAITCCETEQCLVFEAVLEIEGVDTKVAIQDDTCSSDEGCPYSIGCPNLINPSSEDEVWLGTDSNDLFLVTEGGPREKFLYLFEGYDVVIGSDGDERVYNEFYGGGGSTLFLKGGEDVVNMGAEEEKIYFGNGNDSAISQRDGFQDLIFGGEGVDVLAGEYDGDDVLRSIN
eukprot:CAMPEP_0184754424 /NCGR_PEP_ID=MMETSP0315-20130426/44616_1 /TAXON_ID=101924 /ORGANISM="Rhodosorus marinus, Strain UTEX LB 2760" /LENGTH=316 /DNA_ID=CAMNT_0027233845 /DNA_START=500 /DNA_END=1450 /DNA_ORIENTATION=-